MKLYISINFLHFPVHEFKIVLMMFGTLQLDFYSPFESKIFLQIGLEEVLP